MFSSEDLKWETPWWLINHLREYWNLDFTLDPCCTPATAKAPNFFTPEDNGLEQDWGGHIVFMNPPYGREQIQWIQKAHAESEKENTTVMCLVPARTDTKVWHEIIFPHASQIYFIKGRIKFGKDGVKANSAPFPSALAVFDGIYDNQIIMTMELPPEKDRDHSIPWYMNQEVAGASEE